MLKKRGPYFLHFVFVKRFFLLSSLGTDRYTVLLLRQNLFLFAGKLSGYGLFVLSPSFLAPLWLRSEKTSRTRGLLPCRPCFLCLLAYKIS